MDEMKEGKLKSGRSGKKVTDRKQAIAIGLSKARRSGVDLPPPREGTTSEDTREKAERDIERGHGAPPRRKPTAKRRRASTRALKREGRGAASHGALARQARSARPDAKKKPRRDRGFSGSSMQADQPAR